MVNRDFAERGSDALQIVAFTREKLRMLKVTVS